MPTENTWIARATGLLQDESLQTELAQIRAKALLKEISDEIPSYAWTYAVSRVARNATAIAFAIERLVSEDPHNRNNYEDFARLLALTWESLAKLNEGTTKKMALLNAAVH